MNYRFQNLLGAPYRGGNAVVVNNTLLISPVGNRISVTDLVKSETITLPFQSSSNISRIAASPDGVFLLAIDDNSRCLFVNLRRRAVLHRITFKKPVASAKFSPDGSFIAVAAGKLVQIWRSPGFKKEFFPFELVKTFANCNDKVTALDWSPDSDYLLAGSKDLTVRIFCLKKLSGLNKPFMFLGHRDIIVGAFFGIEKKSKQVSRVYTLSRDGAIFSWNHSEKDENLDEPPSPGTPEQSMEGDEDSNVRKRKNLDADSDEESASLLHKGKWELSKKDYFMQAPAKLTSCDYHRGLELVVVGFSNGVFGLYQMPDFVCIHLLSISREKITTATFNELGNWLTFGCARLGQLLVWEWKSESYILKQQGHYFDVNTLAYSPDSQLLATGADDNKIKVWTVSSGFCFVTFSEHTNAVTALHFMASNHCLLSASLDGTVRAWDLFRYRNFRTFTTPSSRQFVSLASDQSGEVICAGTLDSFEIFVWSMKTGRLLDVLSGHEGPVHGLMFSPTSNVSPAHAPDIVIYLDAITVIFEESFKGGPPLSLPTVCIEAGNDHGMPDVALRYMRIFWPVAHEPGVFAETASPLFWVGAILASSSWDRSVRLWDVFDGKGSVETFPHTHDVLTVVYRPDGKQLACSTLDGQIHFWDPIDGLLMYTIEGRRDIAGGRLMTDRRSSANSTSGKCFTTLCYSADGNYILAGGSSKYICMYDVADQVLLRRFQITLNLSLDGVLDVLNSKNMTDAGPLNLIDDDNSDIDEGVDKQTRVKSTYDLPGSMPNRGRPIVRTKCLRIAPTGRSWAAATTEGVLVYSMDDNFIFDPTDLDIDVTPEAVEVALSEDQPSRALILSLRLNEDALIKKCIIAVAPAEIRAVVASVPFKYLNRLIQAFAELLENCPHLEFVLRWCQELSKCHGHSIQQNSRNLLPSLKSLQKAITRLHQDLGDTCSSNEYLLRYLCSTSSKP